MENYWIPKHSYNRRGVRSSGFAYPLQALDDIYNDTVKSSSDSDNSSMSSGLQHLEMTPISPYTSDFSSYNARTEEYFDPMYVDCLV